MSGPLPAHGCYGIDGIQHDKEQDGPADQAERDDVSHDKGLNCRFTANPTITLSTVSTGGTIDKGSVEHHACILAILADDAARPKLIGTFLGEP